MCDKKAIRTLPDVTPVVDNAEIEKMKTNFSF